MSKKNLSKANVASFFICYIFIVISDLICSSVESLSFFRHFTKPSILVALILFFLRYSADLPKTVVQLTSLALIFSLLGDILLLFTANSQVFFMSGLVSFLIAHIFFSIIFNRKKNSNKRNWGFISFTVVYGIILFYLLSKNLGDMLIPVIIYMIVILVMSNMAYLREGKVPSISYWFVFVGSLFFMLSDSLLAINMFYKPIYLENIWVMTTYAIAQLLIIYGVLNQEKLSE